MNPHMKPMDVGTQIIAEIVKGGLFVVNFPDPEASHIFVWSSGAAEQLHALVRNSVDVRVPTKEAALYGRVLQLLGAPDGDDPQELIAWAKKVAPRIA